MAAIILPTDGANWNGMQPAGLQPGWVCLVSHRGNPMRVGSIGFGSVARNQRLWTFPT